MKDPQVANGSTLFLPQSRAEIDKLMVPMRLWKEFQNTPPFQLTIFAL